MSIAQDLFDKKTKIGIVGLGYVGLPLAIEFAKTFSVIGFDVDAHRIERIRKNTDPLGILKEDDFTRTDIIFSYDPLQLREASFFIVAVPTPVDEFNVPELKSLLEASTCIGKVLKAGDYVVYESTVYPGCTEEKCIPILEESSGLKAGVDFKVGYSPERINPGDTQHRLPDIVKIIAAGDQDALDEIEKVYTQVIKAGLFKASSIKVAEAAKMVENTQRDLNIALMNELSMLFDKMGINTYDVLEAASTKWNFLPFTPGLVGGHCIGVDPYYLTHKAESLGHEVKLISASRFINDNMAKHVARKVIMHVSRYAPDLNDVKVLVKGVTFKENVSDIRNSKIIDTVKEIMAFNIQVDIEDHNAQWEEVEMEYGVKLTKELKTDYDAVIIAIPHDQYKELTESYFCSITKPGALIADLKGLYRGKINQRLYWSL